MHRVWNPCVVVLLGGLAAAACSGNPVAPQQDERPPVNTPAPVPDPTPGNDSPRPPSPPPSPSATVTLKGRVTYSAPTSTTEVPGAIVTITDGVNSGKSAVANAMGFYTIPEVVRGSFNVSVTSEGFVATERRVEVATDRTENFFLKPETKTMTYTLTGSVRGTDGTCHDGVETRPCRIVLIPIHNAGDVEAQLAWTSDSPVDLNLTLIQTGTSSPIQRSAKPGSDPESVDADVDGGANYELRITYAAGASEAKYTLTVECPN